MNFSSGFTLALPATGWFTRFGYCPSSLFIPYPTDLNDIRASSVGTKVFLNGFKPTGTSGDVGVVTLQVAKDARIGVTQVVSLSGKFYSRSAKKVVTFAPVTKTFTVGSALTVNLTVAPDGTGGGSINSTPGGIACTYQPKEGLCSALFSGHVSLQAAPDPDSILSTWGGACASCADAICPFTITGDLTCTATFAYVTPVQIDGTTPTPYPFVQQAYNKATNSAVIQARATTLIEDLLLNSAITVILRGGYDTGFATRTGVTTVQGTLTIVKGSLVVDGLVIK